MSMMDRDLLSIQEARILVESARDAHFLINEYQQKSLDAVVNGILAQAKKQVDWLIEEEQDTELGNSQDKISLVQKLLPLWEEQLKKEKVIGVLNHDPAEKIRQIGVSLGVIVVALPAENVVLNTLYTTLIAAKSGNTIIFVPDEKVLDHTLKVVEWLAKICEKFSLPKGYIGCMENVSNEGVHELMVHQETALIIDIDCPEYIDTTHLTGKPIIYGGAGSTPVFIEKSADVKKAVGDIIRSRSFDNGLLPAAEQYVIAESTIAKEAKEEMIRLGAHFMTQEEEKKLVQCFELNDCRKRLIGKDAYRLAQKAGFEVAEKTRVLVSEQDYIFAENPFARDLKCPILTFYLEPDWIHACEKCLDLLRKWRIGHTLAIHSKDTKMIREFAIKKPVGRMIVNDAASFNSLGIDSTLPASMILGAMTTGRGITTTNVTAKDLTYVRQIGYSTQVASKGQVQNCPIDDDDQALLEKFLSKLLAE